MAWWQDIRRILASAMGRPFPKQRPLKKQKGKKGVVFQGELAPIRMVTENDEPELGQQAVQMYVEGPGNEIAFPIKTEQFGPYNPANIPLWTIKMMRRDFVLKLAVAVLFGPLLNQSRYYLDGGTPKTRGFTEWWLRPLLPKLLRTGLKNAAEFGFQAHEIVYEEMKPTIDFPIAGGGTAQLRNAIYPRAIVDLDPETLELYVDPDTGRFEGVETNVFQPREELIEITDPKFLPATKLFLTTFGLEFSKFRGNSVFVPVYNPWWWANVGYLYWGRWMERMGMGVWKGRAPNDKRTTLGGIAQNAVRYVLGLLMQLRSGGVIALPSEMDDKGNLKFDAELMESKHTGEGFKMWIDHLGISKMRGMCIPDRVAIQDGAGSFAGQEITAEHFFAYQESLGDDTLVEPMNQQLIIPNCRYNFGDEPAPRIKRSPLNPALRAEYFKLVEKLLDAPIKDNPENKKPGAKGPGVGPGKPATADPAAKKAVDEQLSAFLGAKTDPKLAKPEAPKDPKEAAKHAIAGALTPEEPKEDFTLKGALDIIRIASTLSLPLKPEKEWIATKQETAPGLTPEGALGALSQQDADKKKNDKNPRNPTGKRE